MHYGRGVGHVVGYTQSGQCPLQLGSDGEGGLGLRNFLLVLLVGLVHYGQRIVRRRLGVDMEHDGGNGQHLSLGCQVAPRLLHLDDDLFPCRRLLGRILRSPLVCDPP